MRMSKLKLHDFANENNWLEIYSNSEEVGYILPDGTTVIANFNESNNLCSLIDSNDSDIDVPKEA